MGLESWAGSIELDTPAGQLLRKLAVALPQDRAFQITVFGSAPLQIAIDSSLLSAVVDLFSDDEQGPDMANNCRRLWPLHFGREIDPRAEIIAPALQKRREGYGEPTRDYKQE